MKKAVRVCVAWVFALGVSAVTAAVAAADTTAVPAWTERGAVDFQVSLDRLGVVVGTAQHSWSHDGKHYQMRLAVETAGMAALLRKLGYVQQSKGELGKAGLRPLRFDVTQLGKQPESAVFGWQGASGAQVSIRRSERERRSAALAAGDQDILSIWHQIGRWHKFPESLLVVGNKDARRVRIVRLEEAPLQVPAGRFVTQHVSVRSEDGRIRIDLWLARDHHMVPVRAVLVDTKSETLILEATAVRLP